MTSALPEGTLGLSANETVIHFSRAGTIFAAVSASVFTAVGIAGRTYPFLMLTKMLLLRQFFLSGNEIQNVIDE
jgi:hypothetical protein